MNFDYHAYTDNIVCCGAHWQGKTFLVSHAIVKPLTQIAKVWVWDYHGAITRNVNPPSYLIKHDIESLEYGVQFLMPLDKSEKSFEKFLEKALSHKDLVVVVDEAHNYSSPHKLKNNHFELIKNAQNQGVSYIEIFQRPQNVHSDVLENARHRFCFALDNLNSIKYMRDWIGVECELFLSPNNRSTQARKVLQNQEMLPEHSYIYRDKQNLTPDIISGGLKI